jgi:DNA-directed RNA polymerase subunit E'/Rpb7
MEYCCSVVSWGVVKLSVVVAGDNKRSAQVNSDVIFWRFVVRLVVNGVVVLELLLELVEEYFEDGDNLSD